MSILCGYSVVSLLYGVTPLRTFGNDILKLNFIWFQYHLQVGHQNNIVVVLTEVCLESEAYTLTVKSGCSKVQSCLY